jgi:hypothetical protein
VDEPLKGRGLLSVVVLWLLCWEGRLEQFIYFSVPFLGSPGQARR